MAAPKHLNPKSQLNLRPLGSRKGILNRATRDLKSILDKSLYKRQEYWDGLVRRIEAGQAPAMEPLLMMLRFGRPRATDDDLPAQTVGTTGPQIVLNLPCRPSEVVGRATVIDAVKVEKAS